MTGAPDPLVLDLVEWVAIEPRPYADALDRWRTSCPRLTVWEDALDRGFVKRVSASEQGAQIGAQVIVTESGAQFLRDNGRVWAREMERAASEKVAREA
jgi:hypothetical protein